MQSQAKTVEQYLAELPADRRTAIASVRQVILKNLDKDIEEGMQYGMIGYYVPHRIFAAGYHCDPAEPLPFACLASQKNYMSLYLMSCYGEGLEDRWFREQWAKTGKKLDMGKSCLRFRKIEDLALDVIGEVIRRVTARRYIAHYESLLSKIHASKTQAPRKAGKTSPSKLSKKRRQPAASTKKEKSKDRATSSRKRAK